MNELTKFLVESVIGTEFDKPKTSVALFGGGFKPPTKGHLEVVNQGIKQNPEVSEVKILVGGGERNGFTQDQAVKIWNLYNDIGFIDQSYLNNLKKILQKKINNVIILEPSLNDLLSDKIYKLEMFDKTFYVPLWHNELVYSYSDENNVTVNFVVKIEPILDDNFFIDDKNDLCVRKEIKFSDLERIFKNGFFDVEFANKKYKIPSEKIKIMKESQIFKFNDGIIRINQSDMFCSKERGSIMIEVNIIE